MTTVKRVLHTSREDVWRVLVDGWLYPTWVVGASRMREVDDTWPQPGARLHHSFGVWPALLDDQTQVIESVPSERLRLRTHGWPFGSANVVMTLSSHDGGTEVVMEEEPVAGPARLAPRRLNDLALRRRNEESLRRLAYIAERRVAR